MDKRRIKKLLITGSPYIVIGLIATNIGQAWRMAVGTDVSEKLLSFFSCLPEAFYSPLPSFKLFDLIFGLCFSAFLWLLMYIKKQDRKKYRLKEEYGSACWGTPEDIAPFINPDFKQNIILSETEFLTMESRAKIPKNSRNKNVLVIGGSGSGKSRFFVTPNILQSNSSYVVVDPKSELLSACGSFILRQNYVLRIFNTINFSKSLHYNPMAYVHSEQDILKLVTVLLANTDNGKKNSSQDPFWENAERLLLSALIAYIHYELIEEDQNFTTLIKMLGEMRIGAEDSQQVNAVDILFDDLEKEKPDCFAVRQYKLFKLSADKTTASILISAAARLAPFNIAELREITAYDELELDKIGDRKTALFLVMSDTDSTFNFLIAMIYTQLFNLLCEKADDVYSGKLPVHVRCLIDEAANVGQIPNLEKLIATIRSREISACLIWQTQSQIKALYKDNAETIMGNCDTHIFLGGSEQTTLKELSQSLGKETIDLYTEGLSRGSQESHSTNYNKTGHELMSVDELAVMDGGKCIVQLRGVRPFLSNKYDITHHPNYKYLAEASPKNRFDIGKYVSVRYKPKGDEPYPLYELGTIELTEE